MTNTDALLIGARHHCFVRGVLGEEDGFRQAFRTLNRLYLELREGAKRHARGELQIPDRKRIGARASGRSKKHANNAEKQRVYRKGLKTVLALRNTPSQATESTTVADAKTSVYVGNP